MDGPVIELGRGRVTFEIVRVDARQGHFGRIGLLDERGALMCLGSPPAHVPAMLTATTLAALGPDRTEPEPQVLGSGVVSLQGIGRCIDCVWMRPDEDSGHGGMDPSALERVRGCRVQLDLCLITTACGCGGTDQSRTSIAGTVRP